MAFALKSQRKLSRFVDIDRILASRVEIPISVILPIYKYGERAAENLDKLLKLNANLYEVIVLFSGSKQDLEKFIERYRLKTRFSVIRRTLDAPHEKEMFFIPDYKNFAFAVFEEGESEYMLLNAGLNISTYPYALPVNSEMRLETNALLALARPINTAQGGSDVITAPMYYSTLGNAPLLRDVWTLNWYSYARNIILPDSIRLFKKSALLTEGGFAKGESPGAEMAKRLISPSTLNETTIYDVVANYNPENKKSLGEALREITMLLWRILTGELVAFNIGYARFTALLMLLRKILLPFFVVLTMLAFALPETKGIGVAMAAILGGDFCLELTRFIAAAMLSGNSREKAAKTLYEGVKAYIISVFEILILFTGHRKNGKI